MGDLESKVTAEPTQTESLDARSSGDVPGDGDGGASVILRAHPAGQDR